MFKTPSPVTMYAVVAAGLSVATAVCEGRQMVAEATAKITANRPKAISTMLNTRGFTRERILFT